jgi:Nucleotidyltransferase of unknown function (DUF6036)
MRRIGRIIGLSRPISAWKSSSNYRNEAGMELNQDLKEFVESLNSMKVEYCIVGAHALAFYGLPRFTGDIDIVIRQNETNAVLVMETLRNFGFGDLGVSEQDFSTSGNVIQLGVAPNRIDLMTSLTGVNMEDVWQDRKAAKIDGIPTHILSKEHLIQNKKATGRPQDISDVAFLEKD